MYDANFIYTAKIFTETSLVNSDAMKTIINTCAVK